mmetsp:Transcript_121760/g.295484  ORF Transcript_121760/g.295484 Transcript_121760/m.295484 type:complete len:204 (+) Transcript_121760:194-805(+)
MDPTVSARSNFSFDISYASNTPFESRSYLEISPCASVGTSDLAFLPSAREARVFNRSFSSALSTTPSSFLSMAPNSASIFSCWISRSTRAKFVPITVMGSARMTIPLTMVKIATSLPILVTGTSSPYPTVVIVTKHHQKVAGMLVNGLGSLHTHVTSSPTGEIHSGVSTETRSHPKSTSHRLLVSPGMCHTLRSRHPSSVNSA